MATQLNSAILLSVAALSAGCISFDQQTVSYQHDTARDQLRVHIVYAGIHGDTALTPGVRPGATGLTEAQQADLSRRRPGQADLSLRQLAANVDLDALCNELAEPMQADVSDAVQVAEIAVRDWLRSAANVQISNGPFYIDGAGRLSAVQRITISNLGAVVRSANRAWTRQAEAWLLDAPEWEWAARIGEPFRITANQLVLRYPAGDEFPGERRWLDGGVLNVVDGMATLTLGSPAAPRVTLSRLQRITISRTQWNSCANASALRRISIPGWTPIRSSAQADDIGGVSRSSSQSSTRTTRRSRIGRRAEPRGGGALPIEANDEQHCTRKEGEIRQHSEQHRSRASDHRPDGRDGEEGSRHGFLLIINTPVSKITSGHGTRNSGVAK